MVKMSSKEITDLGRRDIHPWGKEMQGEGLWPPAFSWVGHNGDGDGGREDNDTDLLMAPHVLRMISIHPFNRPLR